MTPEQRRLYWLEISRLAKSVMDAADEAPQPPAIGAHQTMEHKAALVVTAQLAGALRLVDDLCADLESKD